MTFKTIAKSTALLTATQVRRPCLPKASDPASRTLERSASEAVEAAEPLDARECASGGLGSGSPRIGGLGGQLSAALTSEPLLAIANGDFYISDTTTDSFGWDTRGASDIESGKAILTEDSPFLSNFTQTFTVPEAAKTLQFKLVDVDLGNAPSGSPASSAPPAFPTPPDAFEVALLDANTQESLATEIGLTETDSLLNIQNDGTAYFSDKVRIGGATSGEIIDLDTKTTKTLYFLLACSWR